MFSNFKNISSKVLTIVVGLIAISASVLTLLAYKTSSSVFEEQSYKSMESILTFRGDMLQGQLQQLDTEASAIARLESLQLAVVSMRSGWVTSERNSGSAKKELHSVFVENNPHPEGERHKLIKPEGPSGFYFSSHEKTQLDIGALLEGTPFVDVLFADTTGNIYYSYSKGASFAQNVTEDHWVNGGLGSVFQIGSANAAAAVNDVAQTAFSGLKFDSKTQAADIYFAVPVVKYDSYKGLIIFQVNETVIARILSKGIADGSSQQSVIMSQNGDTVSVLHGKIIKTDPSVYTFADNAFKNDAMTTALIERNDGTAYTYAQRFNISDENYLTIESILQSELSAGSMTIATTLALIATAVLIVMSGITYFIARRMFAPLSQLANLTSKVADGQLNVEIGNQEQKDEIGRMAKALEQFRIKLIAQRELESTAEKSRLDTEAVRQSHMQQREEEAKSLQEVVDALDDGLAHLAEGDLAYVINIHFPEELEGLRLNFNKALASLRETMLAIGQNSAAVKNGSEEMRIGADQLAERTERQAASITETATAISAITEGVRQQTMRADQARQIAELANKETIESGHVMSSTISAMEAIQSSSRQINQIIKVIDEIAFQTNLLALNAGVEAARAGDAGRGFAVVAQEVRELAQRSAAAAKEISSLLKRSTNEVSNGVNLVEQAGKSLSDIGLRVQTINDQMQEILESTREGANTLHEINDAVSNLDTMTQQNAAMVEETTAAIHNLALEASEMDQRLGRFELKGETVTHNIRLAS